MTDQEITRLWLKLYPHARPRYAAEFAALRAGTTIGEIEKMERATRRPKRNAEAKRQDRSRLAALVQTRRAG